MTRKRRKSNNSEILKYGMLITVIVGFIIFIIYAGPTLNLTQDTTEDFIAAIPGIFVFTISVITITRVKGVFLMIAMLGMGVGLAILIYTLYQTGLIIDSMLWGLTLEQNMALVIVLSGIIGGILVAAKRK
jgi:hypothetical protein